MTPWVLALAFATLAATGQAEVYRYGLMLGEFGSNANLRYRQSGMYSHGNAPSTTAPGNGHAYLDFGGLEFSMADAWIRKMAETAGVSAEAYPDPNDKTTTVVNVAVFEARHFDELGAKIRANLAKQYCCSDFVQNRTSCKPDKGLVINAPPQQVNGSIEVVRVEVPHNGDKVLLKDVGRVFPGNEKYSKYKIRKTGLYTLLLANCDYENRASVVVRGQTVWMNPFGYLPGELYGMMPFFGVLACLYFVLLVVWLVLCLVNRRELMWLQLWISVVIGLGALETAIKFGDFLGWNAEGMRNTGLLASGLVFGVTKRALSRVLVLMVSLGYGVVKPSLGNAWARIALLGAAYFMLTMVYDMLTNLPASNKLVGEPAFLDSMTMLVLMSSLVDVIFYMWILQALVQTIQYLDMRKQTVKLQLFRRFRVVLVISVIFSVAWAIYTMVASVEGYFAKHWKSQWNVNAVWEVLYLLILAAIAFLWMPSSNSQRYAYSMELATFDPDEHEAQEQADLEEEAEFGGALGDDVEMVAQGPPTAADQFTEAITGNPMIGGEKLS